MSDRKYRKKQEDRGIKRHWRSLKVKMGVDAKAYSRVAVVFYVVGIVLVCVAAWANVNPIYLGSGGIAFLIIALLITIFGHKPDEKQRERRHLPGRAQRMVKDLDRIWPSVY